MKRQGLTINHQALVAEIARLSQLDTDELQNRWTAICGKAPSHEIRRSLLTRAIAYRLRRSQALDPSVAR